MPRLSFVVTCLAVLSTGSIAADRATSDRLEVQPPQIVLDGAGARQQVAVDLIAPDATVRDVTATASLTIEPATLAAVSASGVVVPRSDGVGTLQVNVQGRARSIPLVVGNAREHARPSYRLDVAAVISKAGCNMGACHGNLAGKGGLRLSLRGDDPSFDFLSLTRDTFGRRVDLHEPEQSLVYRKPVGLIPHEGGRRFDPGSPEAAALLGWIADGARDDHAAAPRLTSLDVWPPEQLIAAPGRSRQLIVTATFANGATRDVTRLACYEVNDPSLADVTPDGLVQVTGPGEVAVAARYLDRRGVARLAFLHDRPDFVWNGPEPATVLDRAVFEKLRSLRVNPSAPVTDGTFLRRAYLDAIGVLPTADEARAFLADARTDKRARLVDHLLARPEFAEFWALKWADLLRNEEKTMGAKGVWVFQRWLRDQIAADVPMDQFARRIVAAVGSTWANPPASFYRTNRDPETAAEAVGQVFLGVRLQCARCHNHPQDVWSQNDYYGLAAYFANLGRKQVETDRRDRFDKHEINGNEYIYISGKPQMVQPRSGEMMRPKPLGAPGPDLGGDRFALDDLADWLTRDNPQFARSLANRVWYHLLGRGIVEPVDDFRDSNPPANPALLDALTNAFVQGGLRLKPLVRLIMTSRVYGLGSTPNESNRDDQANFARYPVKLLTAEVLLDAIGQALDAPGQDEGPRRSRHALPGMPPDARATQLPGTGLGGDFLKVFGKPERLLTCECERSESTSLAQAFQLINGEAVRARLERRDNRIGRLLEAGAAPEAILDELYLSALARAPTPPERAAALDHLRNAENPRRAWEDIAWAVINSKEFLLRH